MDTIPLDYATLRLIWWLLLGILLIGFAVMDGFDLGVATLLPAVARTDEERRIVLNVIGPVWEGNQVWLILGGGAIFAAFPPLYAVSFSGFYIAMFLILVALILRPVGFKFRSKVPDPRWRAVWDWALFASGLVPSLVFGVAMGNVLLGVPFHFDDTLRVYYEGGLFGLLTPFALLCGLVSVAMLLMHGAGMLAMKTSGAVAARARRFLRVRDQGITGDKKHRPGGKTKGYRQRQRGYIPGEQSDKRPYSDRHAGRQQSTNSNGASADQGAGPSSASDSGGSTLTVQFSTPGPLVAAAPTASSSQVHGHHAFSLAAGRRRARTPSRRWCCAGSRWCRLRARSRGSRAPCARAAARA